MPPPTVTPPTARQPAATSAGAPRWPTLQVCGRRVLESLPGGRAVTARDLDTSRLVVLKRLPADCLQGGELHAHVRDRLSRVRELADTTIATLQGAEMDPSAGPMLIWQWVPGRDLSQAAASFESVLDIAREVVTAVERLHLLGIVHGALHLRNVIVTPDNRFTLTHISPLVIDDPRRDVAATLKMLRELNARGGASLAGNFSHAARAAAITSPTVKNERSAVASALLAQVLAESTPDIEMSDLREKLLKADGARFIAGTPPPPPDRPYQLAITLLLLALLTSAALATLLLTSPL